MSARRIFSLLTALLVIQGLGLSMVLAQGTTTTVKGRVVDTDGSGIPRVIVSISSKKQPSGNKSVPTDIEGNYRIPLLPPANDYIIRIDYPGFAPLEVGPLDLGVGRTTVQNITMRSDAETTEVIRVESRGNIVDTESTKTSSSYNAEFIEGLPIIGGSYQDVLTLAPGVTDTDGDGNPNVHGARETGLQYRLDGGNITDPASGTFGQNLNPDIIEELEIITSGASAEFGRADGGFANIITKSGGNDFEGKFSIRWRGKFLNGESQANNDVNQFDSVDGTYRDIRPILSLGGAIVRDKLWYFGSLEILDTEFPVAQVGNSRIRTSRGHYGFAKLTWQVNSYNKLAFQVNTDPREFTGNNIQLGTSPDSDFVFKQGGVTPQIKWTSTISPQLLLETQVSRFDSGISIVSLSDNFQPTLVTRVATTPLVIQALYPCEVANCDPRLGERFIYQLDLIDGTINGPFFLQTDDERVRNSIKTDLSYNVEDALGQHNIKSGIEFADEKFGDSPINNPILFDVTTPFQQTTAGGAIPNPLAIQGIQQVTTFDPLITQQEAESFNSAFYILDAWKPRPNLTINAGIRIDRENIDTSGFDYFDPRDERRAAISLWRAICDEARLQGAGIVGARNCGLPELYDGKPPDLPHNTVVTFRDDNMDGINDIDPRIVALDVNKDGLLGTQGSDPGDDAAHFNDDFTLFLTRKTENFSIENTNISPRFSISWDPWSDGKTKMFGSIGRFYDRLFLDTITGEIGPDSVNYTFVPDNLSHLIIPGQPSRSTSSVSVTQIDREIETPFTDEWTVGIERELAPEWSVSFTYINRDSERLLQDLDINHVTCAQWGDLGIDPGAVCGDGPGTPLVTDKFGDAGSRFQPTGNNDVDVGGEFGFDPTAGGVNLPNGAPDLYTVNPGFNQILRIGNFNSSTYEAYEVKFVKRLHRNWQMQASYTWSEAKGQAENFNTGAGNDPQTVDDEEGHLTFDQRHIIKFQAVTLLPHEIRLGANITWSTGTPFSVRKTVVDLDSTGNTNFRGFFPTHQRNDQRNAAWWKIDSRIEKNFVIGRVQAAAFFAVENLLDDDYLTITDFNLTSLDGIPLAGFRDIGRRFEIGAIFNF